MIYAAIATALFAVSVTCANRAARLVGGIEANFWRLVVATVLLGLWAFTMGQGVRGPAFGVFLVGGVLGIGVGDFGLFQTLERLGTRLTLVLTVCLTTPMGALLEWLWLGVAISVSEALFILVTLAGVGVTLWPERASGLPRGHWVAGILFGLLTAAGGAVGAVFSRKAFAICDQAGFTIDGPTAAFQRVLGGLAVTAAIFALRHRQLRRRLAADGTITPVPRPWRRLWPWVTANALAGITLGVSCMQIALKTTPAGIVLAIVATTPIVVLPLARIVDGDRITPKSLGGALIAVAGAVALAWTRNP
jgi:drug/metabolite transporter (DMT)-like permease